LPVKGLMAGRGTGLAGRGTGLAGRGWTVAKGRRWWLAGSPIGPGR